MNNVTDDLHLIVNFEFGVVIVVKNGKEPSRVFHKSVGSCRKVGLKISYSILFLGCILGVEAIPLRFHLFPKLWVEVKNKSHEVLSYLAIVL